MQTITKNIFWLVYKKPITLKVKHLVVGFTGYIFALILAKLLSIATQILIGRLTGPEFYGQFTIILILANYFSLPMINGWGVAYVRLAAMESNKKITEQILKMLIVITLLAVLLTVILISTIHVWLEQHFHINEAIVWLSIIMAIATSCWMLAKQIFQADQNWYKYTAVELVWASFLFGGALALLFGKFPVNLNMVVYIFVISYLLGSLIALPQVVSSIFAPNQRYYAYKIAWHGLSLSLNALIGTIAFGIDRLLINYALGPTDVGIYQAHFLSTYGVIATFTAMLINYLFPLFVQSNQAKLAYHLHYIVLFSYPCIFIVSMLSGILSVWLYGYPISIALLALLSLFNCVQFHGQLLAWRLAGQGSVMTWRLLIAQFAFLIINLLLLVMLVTPTGILAGGVSLLVGSIVFLSITYRLFLSCEVKI
jgi:O-antigen/teichoic acid export membrane protein